MGAGRNWTNEEYEYLQDKWGVISLEGICQKLNRSKNAINIKVSRLGLGSFLECGEYITFNQLLIAIGYGGGYGYKPTSWIKNRGFPVRYKTVNMCKFRVVYIEDFWKWAEKNKAFLDFSKFEALALGEEPFWAAEKRKIDCLKKQNIKMTPWTKKEDEELKYLLSQFKFGYQDISERLGRTCGAVQRRISDLNYKERPIKAENHNKWTAAEKILLGQMINEGYSYAAMATKVKRSEKAIQGLVWRFYNTENMDTVRGMMNSGLFGEGAYVFNIYEKKKTAAVKGDLQRLIDALKYKRNSMEYGEYWQRFTCMNWSDIGGCGANETDCDSCLNFRRIPPQYCVRCGATFFERETDRVCKPCRDFRKKQAGRKWFKNKNGKKDEEKTE